MDTSTYPTATFVLSGPIAFDDVPAEGGTVTSSAKGRLFAAVRTEDRGELELSLNLAHA